MAHKRTRGQGDYGDKRTRGRRGSQDLMFRDSWLPHPPPSNPPPTPDPPFAPAQWHLSAVHLHHYQIFHVRNSFSIKKTPPLSPNCPLLLVIILFCIALNMTDKVSRKPNRPKFSFCKYNQHTHTKNQHVNKSFALFTWYCLLSVWFDKVFVYYFSKNFVVFICEWQSRTVEQDNSQAVPFKVHLSDQTAPKTSTCPTKRPTKTLRRENNALLKVNDDIA